MARLDRDGVGGAMYPKVEYQTFRRLTRHPDCILFGIRTYTEPLRALESTPAAAAALATNVPHTLQTEYKHYKGLTSRGSRTSPWRDASSSSWTGARVVRARIVH